MFWHGCSWHCKTVFLRRHGILLKYKTALRLDAKFPMGDEWHTSVETARPDTRSTIRVSARREVCQQSHRCVTQRTLAANLQLQRMQKQTNAIRHLETKQSLVGQTIRTSFSSKKYTLEIRNHPENIPRSEFRLLLRSRPDAHLSHEPFTQ